MKSEKKRNPNYNALLLVPVVLVLLVAYSIKASDKVLPEPVKKYSEFVINDDDPILITKSELLDAKGVYFSPDETDFASAFRVISFTVSTRIGDFEESYHQKNGPRFTQQQINLIRKAKRKGKVYIENIKAIGPEGEIRNLGSITFKIRG